MTDPQIYLETLDFTQVDFPESQYYKHQHPKHQIVLHHTVSPVGVDGDVAWWRQTQARIATFLIIGHNGVCNQLFSSRCWAHHLGVKQSVIQQYGGTRSNISLNQRSIGIELDSAGGLTRRNGGWWSDFGRLIPDERVQEYPEGFRGYRAFERYTEDQIATLEKLLLYLCTQYRLDPTYREEMWDVSTKALNGAPGIWSHTSYRPDKSDCHPQPELTTMLKSLFQTMHMGLNIP